MSTNTLVNTHGADSLNDPAVQGLMPFAQPTSGIDADSTLLAEADPSVDFIRGLRQRAKIAASEAVFARAIDLPAPVLQYEFKILVERAPALAEGLTLLKEYHHETYVHSMDVGFLAMALQKKYSGLFAEYSDAERDDFVVGAFLHDIGKSIGKCMGSPDPCYVPAFDKVLQQTDQMSLSPADREIIDQHTDAEKVEGRLQLLNPEWTRESKPMMFATIAGHHNNHNRLAALNIDSSDKAIKAMGMVELIDILETITNPRAFRLNQIREDPDQGTKEWVLKILRSKAKSESQRIALQLLESMVDIDALLEGVADMITAGVPSDSERRYEQFDAILKKIIERNRTEMEAVLAHG